MTDIYTLAPQIIKAIEAINVEKAVGERHAMVGDGDAQYIASLFPAGRVGMDVFVELDERPGKFDSNYASGDWHWKLRQTRNNFDYLFDRFNQEDSERDKAIERIRKLRNWDLAQAADVPSPDPDSAGGKWLVQVRDTAVDLLSEWEDDPNTKIDDDHVVDAISEYADSSVPVYTTHRWQVFTDLQAYNEEDDSGLMAQALENGEDMTTLAGIVLFQIAERMIRNLLGQVLDD